MARYEENVVTIQIKKIDTGIIFHYILWVMGCS